MDFNSILKKWGIDCDVKTILSMWNESHRHYHNLDHLNYLIDKINSDKEEYSDREYEKLVIASLFHDVIYDPTKYDNEEKSAELFESFCSVKNLDTQHIRDIILETKTHEPKTELSNRFCEYDMAIVNENYDTLLNWESAIRSEYSIYEDSIYKGARISFLESLLDKYIDNTDNLLKLISYVKDKY